MDLTGPIQLGLRWLDGRAMAAGEWVECDGARVKIHFRRNMLARRYRLFLDRDGRPRVTIPRRGNLREASRFVEQHRDWLLQQLHRFAVRRMQIDGWRIGGEILFRGVLCRLELAAEESSRHLILGDERMAVSPHVTDLDGSVRGTVEAHLRKRAVMELPGRVQELSVIHQSQVTRVTVRNQRTRWGSCSRRGAISLNWRLIQVPPEVRDYIIIHELMHLREMNHSRRFWALVANACPDFRASEKWLKSHSSLLM